MLYQRRTFTCPASSGTSQKTWDRAFLSEADFASKYGESRDAAPVVEAPVGEKE